MRRRRRESEEEEQQQEARQARGHEVAAPVDPVNEQVLLAAAAVDVGARNELARLPPDSFLVDEHRALAAGLRELVHRGLDYDPATLQRVVGDKVDVSYLQKLAEMRPQSPPNLGFHLKALLWDRQRVLAVTGPVAALLEAARDPTAAPERVKALARHVGEAFGQHGASFLATAADVIAASDAAIDRAERGGGVYPFGLAGLDNFDDGQPRMIPGAGPGKLTTISGISGGGKTTLAARLMLGIARQRRTVLYGAWEVKAHEMLDLMTEMSLAEEESHWPPAERQGWTRTAVITGRDAAGDRFFTPERRKRFAERREAICQWVKFMHNPFRRSGQGKITNERNLDVVRQHIQDSGAEVVVLDLWMRALRYLEDNDVREALVSQQAMAEEMGVHAVLVHQQRLKDIEARSDPRPTREGNMGTSAWIDVSDAVIAPHIPGLFKNIPNDRMEIYVLKQRHGPWPLAVEFDYDPATGVIRNGRDMEYQPAGEASGLDDFAPVKPKEKNRRRR